MEYRATPADRPSWLVRLLWMATVVLGASAGIYLAQVRSSYGLRATTGTLNSWKNMPWTFWSSLTTGLGVQSLIGGGLILVLLYFLVPRQMRQHILPFVGQLVFAAIAAFLIATTSYFLGVFVYDLGPYFR
jgi:hypothetical protein